VAVDELRDPVRFRSIWTWGRNQLVSITFLHFSSSHSQPNKQHRRLQTYRFQIPLFTEICRSFCMAEVLGIIASSVQVAGLAGQIAGVGLKIRALYQEIQDAPDELAFRLQELHLLAGILSRSNSGSSDAASFCERCLSDLNLTLSELESQVRRSKGIRQKVATTKVVLKKQLIQKLDSRLCRSVQLLQLAANVHMASSYSLILQNQDAMM